MAGQFKGLVGHTKSKGGKEKRRCGGKRKGKNRKKKRKKKRREKRKVKSTKQKERKRWGGGEDKMKNRVGVKYLEVLCWV